MATLSRCSNDLAKAFTANKKSDSSIRSEMKENPNIHSLSEPISVADLDQDEQDQAAFERAQTACACSNHNVEPPGRPCTPMHAHARSTYPKPSIEHPQSDNAAPLHRPPKSKPIQTIPNKSNLLQPLSVKISSDRLNPGLQMRRCLSRLPTVPDLPVLLTIRGHDQG
jgi:hypothetical protein